MPMTQADGTLFRRRAVSLAISKRSSPLLSAEASFRRLGTNRKRHGLMKLFAKPVKSETFSAGIFVYCQKCLIFVPRFCER